MFVLNVFIYGDLFNCFNDIAYKKVIFRIVWNTCNERETIFWKKGAFLGVRIHDLLKQNRTHYHFTTQVCNEDGIINYISVIHDCATI